jgi:hypothetical protein
LICYLVWFTACYCEFLMPLRHQELATTQS